MAVQRISEKQFRTRRRDRRMVWVDALAFFVGLIIVTASVGGVIFYEPEVEPIEWTPAFLEARFEESRTCVGFEGGNQPGQGCLIPILPGGRGAYEGEDVEYNWPEITQANVTEVSFRLNWLADVPETDGNDCEDYCNRNFDYTENNTAKLRLQVYTPWGEVIERVGTNNWENVTSGTGQGVPSGSIRLSVPVLDLPEDVPTYKSFSQHEAEAYFNETYRTDEHDGLGQWRTVVTVLRASHANGTVPMDMCHAAGIPQEDVPDGEENCSIYELYQDVGDGGPGPVPGLYDDAIWNVVNEAPLPDEVQWYSSYRSEEQSWVLGMTIRGYEVMAGVG